MRWFALEMKSLPEAIYVPLGPAVAAGVDAVAKGLGQRERVLSGLPHPSGANAERIAFFLGRKNREDLSSKVEPIRLLAARAQLETKVSALLSSRSSV